MNGATIIGDGIIRGPTMKLEAEESYGRCLLRKAISYGDRVAQIFKDTDTQRLTFRELSRRSASVCLELADRGLGSGDVMVVAAGVVPQFPPLMLGAAARGVTVAPINPDYDQNDLRTIITNTLQPRMVVADAKAAAKIRATCPTVPVVLLQDAEGWFQRPDVPVDASGAVELDKIVPLEDPGWLDEPVFILCSSGTTGYPKGVMLSNRNLHANISISMETEINVGEGRILNFSPYFWVSGIYSLSIAVYIGCELVVIPCFNEFNVINTIDMFKVNFAMMVPQYAVSLSKAPDLLSGRDLCSLRSLMVGGSGMDAGTQRLVQRAFPRHVHVFQGYGMTEIGIAMASTRRHPAPMGSVGRPLANYEAKIVDQSTGAVLGPNCEGELLFRSPSVTPGYYRNPQATAEAIDRDGWLHTGDVAFYDDDGFFYITDRLKELIKYRGHHVSPSELEGLLLTQPAVRSACVVGVPHARDGEWPRAYVVLQPGAAASQEELLGAVHGVVANFKQLRGGIHFVDELPMTVTGKPLRRDVRHIAKKEDEAVSEDVSPRLEIC